MTRSVSLGTLRRARFAPQPRGNGITDLVRAEPFSTEEIKVALKKSKGNVTSASRYLNKNYPDRGTKATAQLVRYWIGRMDPSDMSEGYDRAKSLVRTRNTMTENLRLRKDVRALADAVGNKDAFIGAVDQLVQDMGERAPWDAKKYHGPQAGTPMTVELLFSDLQIGKLCPGYNTPIAKARIKEFTKAALFKIEQAAAAGYRIERIVLALIGDIIESDKKHKNSGRACDTGTAEQIADSISEIFLHVVEPLARIGVQLDVIGVTGNHDWDDHGLTMFEPGKQQLSWPLYQAIRLITKRAGYFNVNFDIPTGSYTTAEIYGQTVLYEHGVGVSATETSMKAHKVKRAEQEKKHITYFRMGDKHTVNSFNAGTYVVNGSFFGATKGGTEYSGIAGYDSVPAQWMGFHVPREDDRLSLFDTFTIQLGHVCG